MLKPPTAMARALSGGSSNSTSTQGSAATLMTATDMEKFRPIEPLSLAEVLVSDYKASEGTPLSISTTTLIIDIRPSTSFSLARIKGSINLCAPSTLLKRSGVTVDRIEEEMLSSEEDQKRFSAWRRGPRKEGGSANGSERSSGSSGGGRGGRGIHMADGEDGAASVTRIVVLDTDTRNVGDAGKPAAGGGGPCLTGLLRKFDLAGFAGELCWLVGGFNFFVSKMSQQRSGGMGLDDLVDRSSIKDATPAPASNAGEKKTAAMRLTREPSLRRSSMPHPQPDRSEARAVVKKKGSLVQPRGLPMEAFMSCSTVTGRDGDESQADGGHGLRQMHTSATEPTMDVFAAQGRAGQTTGAACANPFFDNIRQNRELQHGVTEKIPMKLPPLSLEQQRLLPGFLRRLVDLGDEERADELAHAFYEIEKAEQARLIATMQQHAAESKLSNSRPKEDFAPPKQSPSSSKALQLSSPFCSVGAGLQCSGIQSKETFPFSIAAALERGAENRYNNIWTYEHSRIRLASSVAAEGSNGVDCSDYLNGSYLEPGREFGCKRRYIATQAPLPCTFETFWTVVWEQNVRVIAMVTREHESGRLQSHNYWSDVSFSGGLALKLVEEVTLDAHGQPVSADDVGKLDDGGGNLFPSMSGGPSEDGRRKPAMIKRMLQLTNRAASSQDAPRTILHLQFIDWPDYSVPDSCDSLLNYMDLAARGQHEADTQLRQEGKASNGSSSPAGVGPLVVHCSAGVGRTGTYVVIDSVLDILRKSRFAALRSGDVTELGVWEDGSAACASTARGRATTANSGSMWRQPPKHDGNSSTFGTTDYFGGLMSSGNEDNTRTPRRSLKRELSPSAMDIDSSDSTDSTMERDVRSPPPLQRTRSDDIDEEVDSDVRSLTTAANGRKDASVAALFAANHQEERSRRSSAGSGVETPSRAMGSMKITWDSNTSTPIKGVLPISGSKGQQAGAGAAAEPSPFFSSLGTPAVALNATSMSGPPQQVSDAVDLVRKAVETIREQRMSTVQTTRQYVFAYSAVLQGLLRDTR